MIDIHSHILPSVDDGVKTIEETVKVLEKLDKLGVEIIFATPHYIDRNLCVSPDIIIEKTKRINFLISHLNIEVFPGMEMMSNNDMRWIFRNGMIKTLGKSKFVLVELPMEFFPEYFDDMIIDLKGEGYEVIIAHPERNSFLGRNIEKLRRIVDSGVYTQINILSLSGFYGERVRNAAVEIGENDLYHFYGGDLHHSVWMEQYAQSLEILKGISGEEKFHEITKKIPISCCYSTYGENDQF